MKSLEEKRKTYRQQHKKHAKKRNLYSRQYYQERKAWFKQRARVTNIAKYGLNISEYNKKVVDQDGKCAVCKAEPPIYHASRVSALCIDHDHTTGVTRDLLCTHCNIALGHVHDSIYVLSAMILYLEKHK